MNERLKELARQASDSIPDDVSAEHAMYLFQKKLAELIVQECAEVAFCNFHVSGCDLGILLKEHFGVE